MSQPQPQPQPSIDTMRQLLTAVHTCVLCGKLGTLENNTGVRCHGCHAYFHQVCIDPLRTTPIDTVFNGSATLWACDDCADVLAETLDDEDDGVDVDASGASDDDDEVDQDDEDEEDEDDEEEDGDYDCECDCTCGAATAVRQQDCTCECTCQDSYDDDFVETEQETAEKLRRGETVWTRSECTCQVCQDMNAADEQWQALMTRVRSDRSINPLARAVINAAAAAEENGLNPMLDNLFAIAGLPSQSAAEVSRRGRM